MNTSFEKATTLHQGDNEGHQPKLVVPRPMGTSEKSGSVQTAPAARVRQMGTAIELSDWQPPHNNLQMSRAMPKSTKKPVILERGFTDAAAQPATAKTPATHLRVVENIAPKSLEEILSPKQYAQYLVQKAMLEEAVKNRKSTEIPPVQHQQPRWS